MPKNKINIEYCHACAKSIGWECLSQEYHNQQDMLTWKCPKGHVQKKSLAYFRRTIRKKGWCPYCTGKNLLPLEDCKNMAIEMGGECLSEVYVNNREPMVWRCAHGHKWNASRTSAKKIWCKTCKNELLKDELKKNTLQGLKELNLSMTDKNLTNKEFVERVLLFLKTPENGRKKRSRTRKQVEDVFRILIKHSMFKTCTIQESWDVILTALPVAMRIEDERKMNLNQECLI